MTTHSIERLNSRCQFNEVTRAAHTLPLEDARLRFDNALAGSTRARVRVTRLLLSMSYAVEPAAAGDENVSERSFGEFGSEKLTHLCAGLELPALQIQTTLDTLRLLVTPWGDWSVGEAPRWPSDITDDHSPFEFSLALSPGQTDVRILVEAQSESMRGLAAWNAALGTNQRLAKDQRVCLERFDAVSDLFIPDERLPTRFSLWHSAVIGPDGECLFKVYLNPQILGPSAAPGLVQEAFRRLGLAEAWPLFSQLLGARPSQNEIIYFSLDLTHSTDARVKVYVAHKEVTATDLDAQLSLFESYSPGRAVSFVQQMTASNGPFRERPILTCLNYSGGCPTPSITLHVPVRCYVDNDKTSLARLCALLPRDSGEALANGVSAFSGRPLAANRGVISYVSESSRHLNRRIVVYLAPETYLSQSAPQSGLARIAEAAG